MNPFYHLLLHQGLMMKKNDSLESMLRDLVLEIIKEVAKSFARRMSSNSKTSGPSDHFFSQEGLYDLNHEEGRELKRAFAKHADHDFLSSLDTVHWSSDPKKFLNLLNGSKHELSTTLHEPSSSLRGIASYGLWVKGRITLASHDQDKMWTGFWKDYASPTKRELGLPEDEQARMADKRNQRIKSSGMRKLPKQGFTSSNYERVASGAIDSPYILDLESWQAGKGSSSTNEALVGHWRAKGLIVDDVIMMMAFKKVNAGSDPNTDSLTRMVLPIMQAAEAFGIPVLDGDRNVVWAP
jgi:hypothetical protein